MSELNTILGTACALFMVAALAFTYALGYAAGRRSPEPPPRDIDDYLREIHSGARNRKRAEFWWSKTPKQSHTRGSQW